MSSKAPVFIGFEDAELMILLESLSCLQLTMDESNKIEVRELRKRIVNILTGQGL